MFLRCYSWDWEADKSISSYIFTSIYFSNHPGHLDQVKALNLKDLKTHFVVGFALLDPIGTNKDDLKAGQLIPPNVKDGFK